MRTEIQKQEYLAIHMKIEWEYVCMKFHPYRCILTSENDVHPNKVISKKYI